MVVVADVVAVAVVSAFDEEALGSFVERFLLGHMGSSGHMRFAVACYGTCWTMHIFWFVRVERSVRIFFLIFSEARVLVPLHATTSRNYAQMHYWRKKIRFFVVSAPQIQKPTPCLSATHKKKNMSSNAKQLYRKLSTHVHESSLEEGGDISNIAHGAVLTNSVRVHQTSSLRSSSSRQSSIRKDAKFDSNANDPVQRPITSFIVGE